MSEQKRVELPSGGWAVLKDASTLKVKDRNKVLKSANDQTGLMQALSIVDGLIAMLVTEWSFADPIPAIKITSLHELTMSDYDTLADVAGEAQKVLFPKLAKTEETEADADSPFGDSND
jgi:hypothetical protein